MSTKSKKIPKNLSNEEISSRYHANDDVEVSKQFEDLDREIDSFLDPRQDKMRRDSRVTGTARPASLPGDPVSPALTPAEAPNIAHAKDGRFAINDDIAPSGEERKKIGVYIGKGDFELLEAFAEANGFQNPTKAARHLLLRCLHREMK